MICTITGSFCIYFHVFNSIRWMFWDVFSFKGKSIISGLCQHSLDSFGFLSISMFSAFSEDTQKFKKNLVGHSMVLLDQTWVPNMLVLNLSLYLNINSNRCKISFRQKGSEIFGTDLEQSGTGDIYLAKRVRRKTKKRNLLCLP